MVGRKRTFQIGKHTGRRLVENILGKSLDQESAMTLTSRLKRLQERRSKREIYRLVRLLDRERSGISEEELRRMLAKFPQKKRACGRNSRISEAAGCIWKVSGHNLRLLNRES